MNIKQIVLVAFSIITLSGLVLPLAFVSAQYAGYEINNYLAIEDPVEDGAWTTDTEWYDAAIPPNLPDNFQWRMEWTYPSGILEHFLIELCDDTTDDAGDYVQICFDPTANGGTAPQSDDFRIDWVGHDMSGLTIYQGDGSGWVVYTDYTWDSDIFVAESIDASPLNSTPHWIVEIRLNRSKAEFDTSGSGYAPLIRVAAYDESNSGAGVQAWPPTSQDVPSDWGQEYGLYETNPNPIPEPMTIITVVLLSSVALIVGSNFLRKELKTKSPEK
jgi:hypothetical protein